MVKGPINDHKPIQSVEETKLDYRQWVFSTGIFGIKGKKCGVDWRNSMQ
mgnify:CR=1 FL=1